MPKLTLSSGDCTNELRDWLAVFSGHNNVVIEGQGAGLSFSNHGIQITGLRPTVRGLTIEADGRCLSFENPAESLASDVWTYSKAGGQNIWCGITQAAPKNAEGKYYTPKRGQEDGVQIKRAYLCSFRDVFAFGDGDGWFLGADWNWVEARYLKQPYEGFANHFNISGGATYVRGMGMRWNYLHNSTFYGHHLDAWPEAGLYISDESLYNLWSGGWVEPNYLAKSDKKRVIVGPGVARHKNIYHKEPPGVCAWLAVTTGNYS